MPFRKEKSEFIAKIHLIDAADLAKQLLKIQSNEKVRAVVLILDFQKLGNVEFADKKLLNILRYFPIPIVSALKGNVSKKAFSLIENSHLCIASNSTKFTVSDNEIDANEALEKSLINKVVSAEVVETQAFELAEKISELAPLAIRACLKAVNQGLEMNLKDALKLETELFSQFFSTEDMREGTKAFFEKRQPIFQGK